MKTKFNDLVKPPPSETVVHLSSLEVNSLAPPMPLCELHTSPGSRPRRRTTSLCLITGKNPEGKSDPTPGPPAPRNPPVVQLSTDCPPGLGQQDIISSGASLATSPASPLLSNHAAETLKDEGGESKDSDHDDGFPSRFWQRAIGAGESPPSYNSDEDEDYAPSLESGFDWRGYNMSVKKVLWYWYVSAEQSCSDRADFRIWNRQLRARAPNTTRVPVPTCLLTESGQ
ncbi:hypothetical protein AHF37_00206 [Paragonimus kellicotti]|nr:hypothetical protein AHF37_00206 [Paragonimus kellicotti]